jgi:long-chain acyl-CoA synthetase
VSGGLGPALPGLPLVVMAPAAFTTLSALFLASVERYGKANAFLTKSLGRYQPVSHEEALRQVAALARGLQKLGLAPQERLAILSDNRLEWALTDYAALGLGAVSVPIYPTLLEPDLAYILRDSGAKGVVLSTADQLRKIRNIRKTLPELRIVLVMDAVEPEAGVESWWEVVRREDQPEAVEFFRAQAGNAKSGDVVSIVYTSGTAGKPKGVILTHANIISNMQAAIDLFPLGSKDVGISFLPLCHIFERMLDYGYFRQGVCIAYAESFETLPQNLLEVRPTLTAVVPRVLEKIYEKTQEAVSRASPLRQRLFRWAVRVGEAALPYRLAGRALPFGLALRRSLADRLVFAKVRARLGGRLRVIFSGAAPLARDLAVFFYAVGLPVYEGYGLTETSPVIAVNFPGAVRLGTVGRVIPGVEVRLGGQFADEEGGVGREILVRGPNVTPGYYHLEEENREAFEDGWFHTGDLGILDADGFLSITGRKKHLFKTSGGKYVPPEKLENLFQGQPYVAQVLVIGDKRKFVSALIVPNFERLEAYARARGLRFASREDLVNNSEIVAFLEQQVEALMAPLPPHERVRQIALLPRELSVASGELSPSQKIRRRVVEERYRDVIEEIYQRHALSSSG